MAPVTVLHVVDRSWVSSLFIFPSVAAAHDKIRELFPHEAARFTDDDALIALLCDEGTSIDIETLEAEWLMAWYDSAFTDHLQCSGCGKLCSAFDPMVTFRQIVQCPECIEKKGGSRG